MKQKKKWAVLALTVLLLGAGGLFLYRSGFFAACTSIPALRAYIDRSAPLFPPDLFCGAAAVGGAGPHPQQPDGGGGRSALRHLARLFPHLWGGDGWLSAGVLAGPDPGAGLVDRVVSRKLAEKYQKVIREKTTVFLALAFLLPYFPDDMLCILAGLTPITFGRFALLALFTRPWGLLSPAPWAVPPCPSPCGPMVLIGLAGVMIFVLGMLYGDRLERAVLKRLGKE